jgi:hypothetical protein
MKFKLELIQNAFDDKDNFNIDIFKNWFKELKLEKLIHSEFKGNKEFQIKTSFNAVLPYYKNLSVWLDRFNNTWFIIHTKSETLEADLINYRTNNSDHAYVISNSWLLKNAKCISIRKKARLGNDCIGECKYFDNVCYYTECDFGLK